MLHCVGHRIVPDDRVSCQIPFGLQLICSGNPPGFIARSMINTAACSIKAQVAKLNWSQYRESQNHLSGLGVELVLETLDDRRGPSLVQGNTIFG